MLRSHNEHSIYIVRYLFTKSGHFAAVLVASSLTFDRVSALVGSNIKFFVQRDDTLLIKGVFSRVG